GVKAIELEINLRLDACDLGQEAIVAGDPYAIGVDHHIGDALGARQLDKLHDSRVQRRLAARELKRLGVAFGGHEAVEHKLNLLIGQLPAVVGQVRARIGEAQRAVEVAGV